MKQQITRDNYDQISIEEYVAHWKRQDGIPYREHPADDYQAEMCKLDVYYPDDREGVPALVVLHGGGLTDGSRSWFCQMQKLLGCAIFSVEYRLSPQVKCPAYIQDAAAAVAWVKRHAARFHANPDSIFVTGESAGAYLAAILATNRFFLAAEGLNTHDINGYLAIDGEMITHFTIRAERGIPNTVQVVDEYAPLAFAHDNLPPILMVTSATALDMDCRPSDNKLMWDAIRFAGNNTAEFYELPGLGHHNIWPAAFPYMLDFIRKWMR